jgi:hypothetical protein
MELTHCITYSFNSLPISQLSDAVSTTYLGCQIFRLKQKETAKILVWVVKSHAGLPRSYKSVDFDREIIRSNFWADFVVISRGTALPASKQSLRVILNIWMEMADSSLCEEIERWFSSIYRSVALPFSISEFCWGGGNGRRLSSRINYYNERCWNFHWAPHKLSDSQKSSRVELSIELRDRLLSIQHQR